MIWRKSHVATALCALMICAASGAWAAPQCAVPASFPNRQLVETMRRGVNLPAWDHPDLAQRPTEAQLRALAKDGFSHIRLLVERPPLGDDDQRPFAEALFDELILLLSLGYTVSIDLHAGYLARPYLAAGPEEARLFLRNIWRRIAPVVRVFDPQKVAVELLNEPPTGEDTWNAVAAGLIIDLRTLLPEHSIVVGPSGPQRHETLSGLQPFDDPNVIYAVHYYDPFLFTHQGANWGPADDPLQYLRGLPFPADASDPAIGHSVAALRHEGHGEIAEELVRSLDEPWTEQGMSQAFDVMAKWSETYDRPVIVNEFGTLTFTAPRESRLKWLAAVSRQAEARCIGWTHWDFQDGFGLIDPDTGMPDQAVIDALIPPGN